MGDRLDVFFALAGLAFLTVGQLGIPADDAGQAAAASMSSLTVDYLVDGTLSDRRVTGGLYLTMEGLCFHSKITTIPASGAAPTVVSSSDCQQWDDADSIDCSDADGGQEKICANQEWGGKLAMATNVGLGLAAIKFILALMRCCSRGSRRAGHGARARAGCLAASNTFLSLVICLLCLGVVSIYASQCYVGDDARSFVESWKVLSWLGGATGFSPAFGPAYWNLCAAACVMASSFITCLCACRGDRYGNELHLPLNR